MNSGYKRKRSYGPQSSSKKRKQAFKPGYQRTAGYYGRFAGRNAELKFHDVSADNTSPSASGTILNSGTLVAIAQGVGESQRIGRKCTIKKILVRYNCTLNAESAAADNAVVMRIIMYQDKQCNGAAAVVTDILDVANYQSFNNLANSGRFRVLADKTHALNAQNGTATSTGAYTVPGMIAKNVSIPLEYNSTTGAITELRSNNIGFLVIISSSSVDCKFESFCRFRFSDM